MHSLRMDSYAFLLSKEIPSIDDTGMIPMTELVMKHPSNVIRSSGMMHLSVTS